MNGFAIAPIHLIGNLLADRLAAIWLCLPAGMSVSD